MSGFVLLLFAAGLLFCLLKGISILLALTGGYVLFFLYAMAKGFSAGQILRMSLQGILTVKNILLTFVLIGALTGIWRASGCVPAIVCYASGLMRPQIFLFLTFALCAFVSVLTGTSFGTAATMGVICMSIGNSMGLSVFYLGGAILSGVFWGDRCSPVSTSALLVATVTKTDLYTNIRNMLRTALFPTLLVSALYLLVGFGLPAGEATLDVGGIFRQEFSIHPICLLPAAMILLLSLLRVGVKRSMLVSILTAVGAALLVQHMTVAGILRTMLWGFHARNDQLQSLINGGGISSMCRVAAIVCIASCYAGIFDQTGLLNFLQKGIRQLSGKTSPMFAMTVVSVPVSAIACNQTLSIMLTRQLTQDLPVCSADQALYLENTVVLLSGLIPWSIAGAVPLSTVGAPTACMLFAAYLYILPAWNLLTDTIIRKQKYTKQETKVYKKRKKA